MPKGVKNISAIGPSGNVKPITEHVIIPPYSDAVYKVTIDIGSEEIDITENIVEASFNFGVITAGNSTIGDFTIKFLDPIKTNFNKISAFNDVYVYGDYGTSATTKRHRFKIETIGFTENFETEISGKGIGMILSEKSIIYQSLDSDGNLTSKNKSTVIQEILENNFSEITDFSQIETDTTQIQKSYSEIPFIDVMEELCGLSYYFYLDKDLVPNYFSKGSKVNTTEAIGLVNKVSFIDNSDTSEGIYTRVRVYGFSEGGIPIIATKDIGTTNTGGIQKDYIITNSSVISQTQAQELANETAENLSNSTRIGNINSLFLPTLNPGESLFIGLSEEGIEPAYYNMPEFSFVIDNNGDYPSTTQSTIEKKKSNISYIVKDIIQTQSEISENENPYNLDYSRVITFEKDIGTHSNTTINEDVLKPTSTTGTWISEIYTLDNDISAINVKWYGDNLSQIYQTTSAQLWVSINGGATWKYLLFKGQSTIPKGRNLRIKIVFNASDQRVKRIGIYYNYKT